MSGGELTMSDDLERYSRQMLVAGIGEDGQRRLLASRVLVCGCGALGSVLADSLARAGVGFLRIVDRDFVELSNLQRQVLFDEDDVAGRVPKAVAAAEKLARVNSDITLEPIVADIDHTNILRFLEGIDLVPGACCQRTGDEGARSAPARRANLPCASPETGARSVAVSPKTGRSQMVTCISAILRSRLRARPPGRAAPPLVRVDLARPDHL